MKVNVWKIVVYAIVAIGLVVAGYFLGRNTKTETKIEYIKGETITDTLYLPPIAEEIPPVDTLDIIKQCIADGLYKDLWPEKKIIVNDTIIITEPLTNEDTLAILKDWATKRTYSDTLFTNDTIGTVKYSAEVQYNRMSMMSYEYTPVFKQITQTQIKNKLVSPFLGIAYITNPWGNDRNHLIQVEGGMYFKEKYGIYGIYQRGLIFTDDYIGFGLMYKF